MSSGLRRVPAIVSMARQCRRLTPTVHRSFDRWRAFGPNRPTGSNGGPSRWRRVPSEAKTDPTGGPPVHDRSRRPRRPGIIQREAPQYNAAPRPARGRDRILAYFWVEFDGEPTPFEPGQYMTIGVMVDDRIVQRPYSVASPPAVAGTDGYEFYVRLVQGGTFTRCCGTCRSGKGCG